MRSRYVAMALAAQFRVRRVRLYALFERAAAWLTSSSAGQDPVDVRKHDREGDARSSGGFVDAGESAMNAPAGRCRRRRVLFWVICGFFLPFPIPTCTGTFCTIPSTSSLSPPLTRCQLLVPEMISPIWSGYMAMRWITTASPFLRCARRYACSLLLAHKTLLSENTLKTLLQKFTLRARRFPLLLLEKLFVDGLLKLFLRFRLELLGYRCLVHAEFGR